MKRTVLVLLCLLSPAPVAAQGTAGRALERGTWLIAAELGGVAFTDFRRVRARAVMGSDGLPVERRVSASTTATVGARLAYWARASWGLRGGISYSPSSFRVMHDESAERVLAVQGSEEPNDYASLAVWSSDVAVLFLFPHSFGRVTPYGVLGAGAVHYARGRDAELPPEAREQFAAGTRTQAAAVFGIGATLPLQRHDLLLSFELTNHLSRSPLAGARAHETFAVDGVSMEPAPGDEAQDANRVANQLRLVVSLTLPLR